ncbi:MAG: ISNCY family transposase [Bacteroidales bacterium]|nr:ISNCY family transposase [Bacteroidales bacterium]
MRKIIPEQLQMGEIPIEDIKFDLTCRDEIPQLLKGLQHIYCNTLLRQKVFLLLRKIIPKNVSITNGRKGMNLWQIFVLGSLRLNCNWDYDKLQEIANNHIVLRQMLGHSMLDIEKRYSRQTLNDNLRLFTSNILDEINQVIVNAGVKLVDGGKKKSKPTHTRCDSFVLETNVHFPTDLNLLWDALRKALTLSFRMAEIFNIDGWRQTTHNIKAVKKLFRAAQKERTRDKDGSTRVASNHATQQYIDKAMVLLERAANVANAIDSHLLYGPTGQEIKRFVEHGIRQIDQISRRCFKNEKILHHEKVFSVFEEHTEWISKGKAGVPQELGLRVCIVESSCGFILHHKVMQNETDDAIAVPIIKETLARYPYVKSCSFDKGFHSPQNQTDLSEILQYTVLPRKGKLNEENRRFESTDKFTEKRRQHSAVESAINAIENHGLDRCRDRGLNGFKRYVALAIVARNIQLIGAVLRNKELALLNKDKQVA